MNASIKNRIQGLFMGQLAGDALGTRYEFESAGTCANLLKRDMTNRSLQILGGGAFCVEKGQYTDDSELALGVWFSIVNNKSYNFDDIGKEFYKWYYSNPFDIGNTTRSAMRSGTTASDMTANAEKYGMSSMSNGCLMKISAVGALKVLGFSNDLASCSKQVCALTNPNPVCVDMCECYVRAIDEALMSGDHVKAFNVAVASAKLDITKMILNDAMTSNTNTKLISDDKVILVEADGPNQGYLGVAFQNAFYHLYNTKNDDGKGFVNTMTSVILLGGDVDTNCCIVGALYAACHGVDCIPTDWKDAVMKFQSSKRRTERYEALNHQKVFDGLNELLSAL